MVQATRYLCIHHACSNDLGHLDDTLYSCWALWLASTMLQVVWPSTPVALWWRDKGHCAKMDTMTQNRGTHKPIVIICQND